jgi:hypothetical protein
MTPECGNYHRGQPEGEGHCTDHQQATIPHRDQGPGAGSLC